MCNAFYYYLSCVASFRSSPRLWVSNPPMSVSETTMTGYSCGGYDVFIRSDGFFDHRGRNNSVQLALREAESANYPWQYKTVLTYSCSLSECDYLWFLNFSNYLIGSATFTNLKPNTLYTMVTFPCYSRFLERGRCTVSDAFDQSTRVNISTTPLGKHIRILHTWYIYICYA